MTGWNVNVKISVSEIDDGTAEQLLDALGHEAVMSFDANSVTASMTIDTGSATAATRRAISTMNRACKEAGIDGEITRVQAMTFDELERDLDEPNYPEFLGITEIAEELGVSKQRVSQLSARRDFPQPLAHLASGPIWPKPWIQRFVDAWPRKAGRPPVVRAARE